MRQSDIKGTCRSCVPGQLLGDMGVIAAVKGLP